MFPPMTPQTERVRSELENREIDQRAAQRARLADGKNRNLIQAVTRLLARVRKPRQTDLQSTHSTRRAEQQTI